jgi:glycosyltransferase involved in cell wall biosynthesis
VQTRKSIAILLSRFPYPLDKGDKLRAYHQIKQLSWYYHIHLFALQDKEVKEKDRQALEPFCRSMTVYKPRTMMRYWQVLKSLLRAEPAQVGYFYDPKCKQQWLIDIAQLKPDTLYAQLSRTALYVKDMPYHKVLDLQDAFALNYDRMQANMTGLRKWFYQREARTMRLFEQKMIPSFDACTIISDFDKSQIAVQPNQVAVVPNGVDTQFFKAKQVKPIYDILFCGNLTYIPNQQAVNYLIHELLPALVQKKPDIRMFIVGTGGEAFQQYSHANLTVGGWIEDIRQAYSLSRLFVAPLFSGAGLQNKLLEAMSMGLPCITTSIANASLLAVPDEEIILAGNVDEFVEKILSLLNDTAKQSHLSTQARHRVEKDYSWESANRVLMLLL